MAANTQPIFGFIPQCIGVVLSAANANRDGTGSLTTVFTAGTNGSYLNKITFISSSAIGTPSTKVVRVFITDTTGSNPFLRAEAVMAATVSSATAIGAVTTITFTDGLILKAGQLVKVAQSVYGSAVDTVTAVAEGSDY